MNQPNRKPTRKVTAGGLAGALSILVVYAIGATTGREIPAEAASALTTVIGFVVAYFVPDADPPEYNDEVGV